VKLDVLAEPRTTAAVRRRRQAAQLLAENYGVAIGKLTDAAGAMLRHDWIAQRTVRN
jgi:hypothetical protein